MMHIHQRSVNVSRKQLLEILKKNLAQYKIDYAEAVADYQARLIADLELALKKVKKVKNVQELKNFEFKLPFPVDYSSSYEDVIKMFEYSVDENINLDGESFKAFIENDWSWSSSAHRLMAAYKTVGTSFKM